MNENAIIDWVEDVLKSFTFGKTRLFAWDSFRAHLVQSVNELLNKGLSRTISRRHIMEQAYKRSTERNV